MIPPWSAAPITVTGVRAIVTAPSAFPGTPVVAARYARPSTAPGWGVELDEKLAAEHPPVLGGHERWAAKARRPDGSIEAP